MRYVIGIIVSVLVVCSSLITLADDKVKIPTPEEVKKQKEMDKAWNELSQQRDVIIEKTAQFLRFTEDQKAQFKKAVEDTLPKLKELNQEAQKLLKKFKESEEYQACVKAHIRLQEATNNRLKEWWRHNHSEFWNEDEYEKCEECQEYYKALPASEEPIRKLIGDVLSKRPPSEVYQRHQEEAKKLRDKQISVIEKFKAAFPRPDSSNIYHEALVSDINRWLSLVLGEEIRTRLLIEDYDDLRPEVQGDARESCPDLLRPWEKKQQEGGKKQKKQKED